MLILHKVANKGCDVGNQIVIRQKCTTITGISNQKSSNYIKFWSSDWNLERERGEVLVAVNQETECRTFPGSWRECLPEYIKTKLIFIK